MHDSSHENAIGMRCAYKALTKVFNFESTGGGERLRECTEFRLSRRGVRAAPVRTGVVSRDLGFNKKHVAIRYAVFSDQEIDEVQQVLLRSSGERCVPLASEKNAPPQQPCQRKIVHIVRQAAQ